MRAAHLAALIVAAALARPAPARADEPVPVWLGITYQQVAGPGGKAFLIETVHEGSGAETAGLRPGDLVIGLGDDLVTPQTELPQIIAGKKVGDHLKLIVDREEKVGGGFAVKQVVIDVVLLPRSDDEILQRRLVDKPAPDLAIARPGGGAVVDLAALKGKVAVLAFFPQECDACAQVVSALGPWAEAHDRAPVVVLGATAVADPKALAAYLARNPITVPVGAIALSTTATDANPYVADARTPAVTFVVIDGKGIVRAAAIVPPGGEDRLDDVCVAADRAVKALRRR